VNRQNPKISGFLDGFWVGFMCFPFFWVWVGLRFENPTRTQRSDNLGSSVCPRNSKLTSNLKLDYKRCVSECLSFLNIDLIEIKSKFLEYLYTFKRKYLLSL